MESREQVVLLMIKGAITELPEDQQKEVGVAIEEIRNVLASHNPGIGAIAVSLIGAELAAK